MSHFYGEIKGNRGEATRMGTMDSGFRGHIRGWKVGGSVNCNYNKSKDRDEISIYATGGSDGGSSEHLADVIETDNRKRIIINSQLDKYLNVDDYVQMKEDISATIFEFDCTSGTNYNRPDEQDCNDIAELIMTKLNYKLLEDSND